MNLADRTILLRKEAARLGFDQVGISRAERLDDAAQKLEDWLNKGFHGKMGYMENHDLGTRIFLEVAHQDVTLAHGFRCSQQKKTM